MEDKVANCKLIGCSKGDFQQTAKTRPREFFLDYPNKSGNDEGASKLLRNHLSADRTTLNPINQPRSERTR